MKNKLINIWQKVGWKMGWVVLNIFMVRSFVLAEGETPTAASAIKNPIASDSFAGLLTLILNIIVEIGTPIVVIAIIFVGFKFITAQGKPAEITKAKEAFLYVIIGAAIVIGCYVIVAIIQSTVDVVKVS